ncbi:MAG: SpoIVB peptidase [Oscillospiraceae bacterium]|nr:SpoIVB peptidase [Oscillospiraceae bacterium]
MLKYIRYKTGKLIYGALSGVLAGFVSVYAYLYAALPMQISAQAGASLGDVGFSPAVLRQTSRGAEYFLGNIPIKRAEITETERRYVIPSGKPFGIKMLSDGVMIIGAAAGSPAEEAGLREGDVIISVNGAEVSSNEELSAAIRECDNCAELVYRRGESCVSVSVATMLSDGVRKIGAWVRDSAAGIGTLTFVEPETGIFGGLGHAVSDATTGGAVPFGQGEITAAEIFDIVKGEKGAAGELCGAMLPEELGQLSANTPTGVFGKLDKTNGDRLVTDEKIPAAFRQEVKPGTATILTTIDGSEPREYSIEIERINLADLTGSKGMLIKITDAELLEKTGGIVRGMSGSPIIQNGKLAGAVTHVLVGDPTRGYAVFAESMLEKAQ